MSFLDYIRSKPRHARNVYALSGAILITFIVGLVWVTTVKVNFSQLELQTDEESFSVLKDMFSDTQDQAAQLLDAVDSAVEEDSNTDAYTFNLDSLSLDSAEEVEISNETSANTEAGQDVPLEQVPDSEVMPTPQPAIILIGTTTPRSE